MGVLKSNIFLNMTEHILTITWNASSTPDVAYYNIYRDNIVAGKVVAGDPLPFVVALAGYDNGQGFWVTAVTDNGSESNPVPVTMTF